MGFAFFHETSFLGPVLISQDRGQESWIPKPSERTSLAHPGDFCCSFDLSPSPLHPRPHLAPRRPLSPSLVRTPEISEQDLSPTPRTSRAGGWMSPWSIPRRGLNQSTLGDAKTKREMGARTLGKATSCKILHTSSPLVQIQIQILILILIHRTCVSGGAPPRRHTNVRRPNCCLVIKARKRS